jgi:hypothetical protein
VFLTSAATHAAVTTLSVYAPHQGRGRNLGQAFAFILGQHGSGVWNGAVSRRRAIVTFCKQPEKRAGGGAPPARSPAMRFATNYETRSLGVYGGSHPEERHLGARLVSSLAKTARPQDGALYSCGATFPGYCYFGPQRKAALRFIFTKSLFARLQTQPFFPRLKSCGSAAGPI